jgi:succinate dehydrogenase / fumarate reductase cytochrome b subunit
VLKFWCSSIGKKILMALSGAALILFLIAHLLGNLEVFAGPEAINAYGVFLRSMPKILWAARIGLIVTFVLHIYTSIQLSLEHRAARPVKYANKKSRAATYASRTMLLGGLVVASFLLYHLAHFTWGITNPDHFGLIDAKGRHDVYSMIILGFSNPYICALYALAQVCLAFHLSHGIGSAAQTFGLTTTKWGRALRFGGVGFAVVLCLGYLSIPFSVLMGWLHAA